MDDLETVHTITDYWDGPRSGIADFAGRPHRYECQFDEAADDWTDRYRLMPIDTGTFELAMELHSLFLRLAAAADAGQLTSEQFLQYHASGPCLPADRSRCSELRRLLGNRLAIDPVRANLAVGRFAPISEIPSGSLGTWGVRWQSAELPT